MSSKLKLGIQKYKKLSPALKAVLWFSACNFLQRGFSMLTTPIFTRLLSTYEYGIYSTYLSLESIISIFVTLSLYKSIMKLYANQKIPRKNILLSVSSLEFLVCSVWLIVAIFMRNIFTGILGLSVTSVLCLFIYILFSAGIQCWSIHMRYEYRYIGLIIATLLMTVGSSILNVILVLFVSATAESRILGTTFITTLIGICIYISLFRRNKGEFYNKEVWRFALGFCIPLLPHYFSEFILQSSDKLMINYMCGSSDVAIYSVAYSVGSLINLITSAINTSFAPYQYQKIAAGEYKRLTKHTNLIIGFVGSILCLIMLFSREIVMIFGGVKYAASIQIIIPICLGVFFNYLFQLFARVQEYYVRRMRVVIPSVLSAILNIVLNYIFINLYGFRAAAYTTLLCYVFFCFVHYLFYRMVCKEEIGGSNIYDIRSLTIMSVAIIILGIIISIIGNYLILKYAFIFVSTILCVIKRNNIWKYLREVIRK